MKLFIILITSLIVLLLLFLVILPLTVQWPFKMGGKEKFTTSDNIKLNMTNVEYQKLKIGQNIIIDMLKEFDRICNKYNIKYWAVGGTLIGAIRHKGFIPWDNDVDVGIMDTDFKKLCKILKKELTGNYKLVLRDDPSKGKNRYWNGAYSKPDSYPEAKIFYSIDSVPFITKNNSVIKQKPAIDLFPYVKKNNMITIPYPFLMKYSLNEIFPLKRLQFGKINISVPNQYKKFISRQYPNYKTLPKFHDRKLDVDMII